MAWGKINCKVLWRHMSMSLDHLLYMCYQIKCPLLWSKVTEQKSESAGGQKHVIVAIITHWDRSLNHTFITAVNMRLLRRCWDKDMTVDIRTETVLSCEIYALHTWLLVHFVVCFYIFHFAQYAHQLKMNWIGIISYPLLLTRIREFMHIQHRNTTRGRRPSVVFQW